MQATVLSDSPQAGHRVKGSARTSWFRILIWIYFGIVCFILLWGAPYYLSVFSQRAFHPQHHLLKPSGLIGQSLGIVGTGMMCVTFLYYMRKHWSFLQFGSQKQWLRVHIFMGLAGPFLITIHTTGKLLGLAALAFYSMMAVVLSGVVGRYLYRQIPRTKKGQELSLQQIETQLKVWVDKLHANQTRDEVLEAVEEYLSHIRKQTGGLVRILAFIVFDDLKTPINVYRAWRIARIDTDVPRRRRLALRRLILRQRKLLKRLAILDASQRLFSLWHIFHRPFTFLATVLIFLHIAITTYFRYGIPW